MAGCAGCEHGGGGRGQRVLEPSLTGVRVRVGVVRGRVGLGLGVGVAVRGRARVRVRVRVRIGLGVLETSRVEVVSH